MSLSTSRLLSALITLCSTAFPLFSQSGPENAASGIVLDGHKQRHVVTATAAEQPLRIENLVAGETYALVIPEDQALGTCRPFPWAPSAGIDLLQYDESARQLTFKTKSTSAEFVLRYDCTWDAAAPPRHYVSVYCQTCVKKDLKEYVEALSATLEVQGGASAEELVKDILIGGNCFDVNAVTFQGNGGQIGTFSQGQTNIGFNTGVIMATGDISVAPGPNNSDGASAGYGVSTPDPDLALLTNGALFDRASIEFDFTPTQSPLSFNFVFASEEYCEYVNSQFNDVFGFFISGPGIPGGQQNIAIIPTTNIPVAINNVNHLSFPAFYVNNQPASSTNLCGQNPATGPAVNEVQYDGFTRKFTAIANVTPCETYHIKLKIADVGDGVWDSAVFINAGSFDAGGNVSVEFEVNGSTDVEEVNEGCGTVKLIFRRLGNNAALPVAVQYVIGGTATNGVDYTGLPPVVVIPAGQFEVVLTINITNDLIVEGAETVFVRLNNPCSCLNPEETLTILDLPALDIKPDTVTICGPGSGTVSVAVLDGVPPYTFNWQNGSTEDNATLFVGTSTNVRVTVTDACGKTKVATARIIVRPLPIAQLVPPAPQICELGEEALIKVNFVGTGPFTLEYKHNGDVQPAIYDITTNPYFLTVNEPGLYQIQSVVDSAGCEGTGQGAITVLVSNLALSGVPTNVQCATSSNGSINTTVTGGQGPYTYNWSGPVNIPSIPDPMNLPAGTYNLTVTDFYGCTRTDEYTIIAPNALTTTIVNVVGVNCATPNNGSIDLNVTGGFPAYTYKWSNTTTVQDPSGLTAGVYTVTVTDQSGCTRTTTATVPGDFAPPTASAVVNGILTCTVTSLILDGSASSAGPNFSYLWTAAPGNIVSGATTLNPVVNQPGNYTITVRNATNGCTASATVTVNSNTTLPTAVAGPPQTITCAVTNATLNGTGSSSGPNFTYQWTAGLGGSIVSGANTLNPVVSTPATYTLVVTNTDNGCTQSSNVAVTLNNTPPTAIIAPPGKLTCTISQVTLNGSASPTGGSYAYQWTTLNGNVQSGQASQNAVVTEEGDYTLIVTNTQNGCTGSATVFVDLDFTDPAAVIVVNQQITCNNPTVTLDGTGSSSGPGYNFYWTATAGGNIVSGQNTLMPTVNAPGSYSIIVTNLVNNCTASASVLVTQNITPPIVNPGEPGTLTCDLPQIQLGDPATIVLPNITYQWTASPGGNIVSGANTPSITLDQPGTYTLLVTNTQTGCTSTGNTLISQNITPPNAVIGTPGQINCVTPTVQISGAGSSVGANFSYQWSTTNGNIAAGATTLTPTVNSAGNYLLVVTNSTNGCTTTASATITSSLTPPAVAVAPPTLITCFQPQQTLNGTGSSTGSNFQYQWGTQNGQILSGANTLQPVISQAGTYTLLVTNTSNSCTSSASVTVNADVAAPIANAGQSQTLNCTSPMLSLDGSGSSQGAVFTYQWTTSGSGNLLPPTNILNPQVNAPGNYQLLVTNTQNGCTSATSVQVLRDNSEPVTVITPPAILNCTANQIVLNSTGSSAGVNYVYTWSGPGIVGNTFGSTATVNQPGPYSLLIANTDNGCTTTASVTVVQDIVPPTANAGADNILNCYQPQLQIGGNSSSGQNFTYSWTGFGIISGANTANPVVDQPGPYTLVVTNTTNGCTATDNVVLAIDQNPPQAAAGPGFQLTCTEVSYTLNPTASTGPNFTYNWSTNTGNFLSPTDILTPTVNGVGFYFLTVTNTTNGCTATDVVQITQSADFPTAIAGAPGQLTCAVTTITLNGAGTSTGSQYTYEWTPTGSGNIVSGANTLTPVVDEPDTYQLQVTNTSNNCVSYSSVVITQNIQPPVIDAGSPKTLTCSVASIGLQGSVGSSGNHTYFWSSPNGGVIVSGANTLTPSISAVGIYELLVTNTLNGCTSTDMVEVLADQNAPVATLAQPDILTCIVKQVPISAAGSSTGNVTYNWTTANGNFTNLSDPLQPVVDKPGVYTLLVTNLDNGCTVTATATVSQDIVVPTANAGAVQTLTCAITTLQLNGTGSSQVGGPYYYEWTTPNGVILSGNNSLTPTVSAPGAYALLVQNTTNGCSATAQVQVQQNTQAPTAAVATAPLLTCAVQVITLDGSASSPGSNFSYAWSTSNGNLVGNISNNTAQANAPGTYTLTVLNTLNGCSSTTTALVSSNTVLPNADAGPPFTLTCSVEEVTLQAFASSGPQFTYGWNATTGGNILSGANTLTPRVNKAGTYTLTVTNTSTGCKQTDNALVYLETNVPTDFEFDLKRPSCKDNDGVITFEQVTGGYGPYLYSINNGQSFSQTIDFGGIAPGTYTLWIQDANGCEFQKTLVVPKAPDPGISIDPEFEIEFGDSLQLKAVLPSGYPLSLIDSVIWNPLEGLTFLGSDVFSMLKPIAKPFRPTEYEVTVVSKDGCRASDRVLIRVDNDPNIYIPNAFSPWDENGENDIVLIFAKGSQIKQVNSFQIFDRWGTMVFQKTNFQPNDPKYGWNGYYHGALMTPAVFVYYAEIELIDGRRLLYKGDITLVR
ncbi:MAG: choice-of-anchor L domain-containing protein [Saprospiraceae bacterium]|nr:choice-of-anchor L domain-containing protein [Saprospiraceae bacterium]